MTELGNCILYDCGYFYIRNPNWKHMPRGKKARNNLIFVTEGVLYFEENGTQYTVQKNECLFLEGGLEGRGYRPSGVKTEFFYLLFTSENPIGFPKHFALSSPNTIWQLYTQIVQSKGRHNYPTYAINTLMKTLFYEILYQTEETGQRENPVIEDVKNYIYKERYLNPTVSSIAKKFHFSKDHLSKLFKQHEHISLKVYLNNTKLSLINNLLATSDFSVKEISDMMKFPDASSFCKFYKYHTSITPSDYRIEYFKGIQSQKKEP